MKEKERKRNMYMDFVVIKYKGKDIYLGADDLRSRHTKQIICKWVKDVNDSIWFNTEVEAVKYANTYFKNFTDWEIIYIDGTI